MLELDENGEWQKNEDDENKVIEPFGTTDGELDHVAPDHAFALGVQWTMLYFQLEAYSEAFSFACHKENVLRLVELCARRDRTCDVLWEKDGDGEWELLEIGPRGG